MGRSHNSSPQTLSLLDALLRSRSVWRHGYDLSRETSLKSGTLYPMLIRLEGQGWLETRWQDTTIVGRPARHLYRLTSLGSTEAAAALEAAEERRAARAFVPRVVNG